MFYGRCLMLLLWQLLVQQLKIVLVYYISSKQNSIEQTPLHRYNTTLNLHFVIKNLLLPSIRSEIGALKEGQSGLCCISSCSCCQPCQVDWLLAHAA
ncbi:hypothetical protein ACQKWADRAFT_294800 [Trichoderma austrokoningii]